LSHNTTFPTVAQYPPVLPRETLTITSQSATVNEPQGRPLSPPRLPSRTTSAQSLPASRSPQGPISPQDQARLQEWEERMGNREARRPKSASPPIPYDTKPRSPPVESTPAHPAIPGLRTASLTFTLSPHTRGA
jgi:hypothetical protein